MRYHALRVLRSLAVLRSDVGGAVAGFLVAILVLVAVGVAAFFYFGGEADVDIKKPNVEVSASPEET